MSDFVFFLTVETTSYSSLWTSRIQWQAHGIWKWTTWVQIQPLPLISFGPRVSYLSTGASVSPSKNGDDDDDTFTKEITSCPPKTYASSSIVWSWSCFFVFVFFYINLFILFLAVLGLRFCERAFSSCGERGPLFIAVRGPLVASSPVEHRLQTRRLSSCGSRA